MDSRDWEYPIAPSEDCRDRALNVITSLGGSCREDFDVGYFIQYPSRIMGMELPISAAKADGSCYARATCPAVVGAKLEHPAIGGSLSPRGG